MIFGDIGDILFGEAPEAEFRTLPLGSRTRQVNLDQLIRNLFAERQAGAVPFEGQLTAGPSNLENLSLEALEQQALGLVSGQQRTQQTAEDTLQQLLLSEPTDFEDFFKKSVEDPALQSFTERILPAIRASQAKNFFSSGRLSQEERATEDLLDSLTGARAELAFGTREAAEQRKLEALGLVDSVTGTPINQAIALLNAGRVPREIEQAGLTAEYGEFLRQQDEKARTTQQLLGALDVDTMENIGIGLGGQPGLLGSFLGTEGGASGLMSLIGLAASFFSSKELKEDIEPLDEDEILAGLQTLDINSWKYIGDSTPHLGPMAEDFQETFGVGDGKTIHLADVSGVLLGSQKALAKRIAALEG